MCDNENFARKLRQILTLSIGNVVKPLQDNLEDIMTIRNLKLCPVRPDKSNRALRIEEINNGFKESGSEEENSGEQPRASVEAGPSQIRETPAQSTDNDDMIPIGKGHAKVLSKVLTSIKWMSYTKATRTLLEAIFPRRVLATHSLSGKQSPAFMDRPAKKILNPKLVDDIVNTVSTKCVVSKNLVRKCITVKCADEAKTCRQQKRALNDKIPL
ncbi:hypothetical protein PYW07_005255 [Mythimna separata]|uniref:BEN domain-containing protein n=1 Tax=Mythimna separata TaxID=271217 RepID=A0AAD7YFG2_MYTSE|nr:hypothetical protein PYW07_005255 [Mythimna separata]